MFYLDLQSSGKLPITFQDIGQVPIYYNIKNTGRLVPVEIRRKIINLII